ncbi:prolyl oligopeptidase family serine peptidase [Gracilimonas sp. BCB1]|uniref:carboxylesterase family protein n=1 Tax=Gracilimonas sp. BCB1 TaxID=3152362 RepID=UPI0032D91CDA
MTTIHPSYTIFILIILMLTGCQTDKLERISYDSQVAGEKRDFYLYLPNGYELSDKNWPVLMFLHGNGERGNGKDELGFVLMHGPLKEAWVYKRDLPFIIISPQLHMFGMDETASYLQNRDTTMIPQRLEEGVPERTPYSSTTGIMEGEKGEVAEYITLPNGWERVGKDLLGMLDYVQENYRADSNRVYLTGLSYGGFGTWQLASSYPDRFAAIAPVVGWGHPDLMDPIAEYEIPVWTFAGGRDQVVRAKHFYPGLNKLEELGHNDVRFTTHQDLGHDTWKRVYRGDDLYNWFLTHQLSADSLDS